jgi:hypothetical protein
VNGDTITLKEVLQWIDSPEKFSLMVITANKQKGSGGEELWLEGARGHRAQTLRQREQLKKVQQVEKRWRRNPNHYDNSTRNVLLQNGDIITIHIRLIRVFNGKTVL